MLTSELLDKLIGTDRVSGIIQDPYYTEAMVLSLLNEAQLSVCGGGERNHGLPLLAPMPDLLSSATVTLAVDAVSVAMPDTFHRAPLAVIDAQRRGIKRIESHLDYLKKYPVLEIGNTIHFCQKGSVLFYGPAKAQDVTVYFYRLPVDMTLDSDSTPDGIPVHLQERLLVSHVANSVFASIEDALEGRKGNTGFWWERHQAALTDLERFIGPVDKDPETIQDYSDYISSF